jgi:hypothetical protein
MKRVLAVVVTLLIFAAAPAWAQRSAGFHGWGPRGGVTINPDQVHFGVHFDMGDLAKRLMLIPNVELGFGDNVTVLTPAFEVDYRFYDNWGSWNPYVGGGVGPVFAWYDGGASNTDFGLTVQGGIARQLSSKPGFMFIEMKVGLADYPDVKFTVGWNFGSTGSEGGKSKS